MATFLVTGGGGFIGSNLVEALLKQGHSVRALDDFSSGRRSNLESANEWAAGGRGEFRLIEGDVCDRDCASDAVDGVDFVLHKAAIPSVQRSVQDPIRTNRVNIAGTLNMLEVSRQAGVRRFVFASSSSIYGESESLPKVESMPPAPISPYGLQKYAGETYCRLYFDLYRLPTVALRYFNVFGPRQDPNSEYSAVIPKFITAARNGRPATIYGDGEQSRDFTFIHNVVRANILACEADESSCGATYNIACGDRITLNDLLRHIGEIDGHSLKADYVDPREGDIRHSLAGIERAAKALGYRPEVDLVEGLHRTMAAY